MVVKGSRVPGLIAAAAVISCLAACGGGGGGATVDDTTIPPDAAPREIAEAADLEGVRSGRVGAELLVTKLKKKQVIQFRFNGSFRQLGEGSLPLFSMAASSEGQWNGRAVDFNSLLTVLPEHAVISYGRTEGEKSYEIETPTLEELRSKLNEALSGEGKGDVGACLEAARDFDFAQLFRDPKIEDRREESDGTNVFLISGKIDIPQLKRQLVKLAQDPECGAQLEALGLPPPAQLEAARVDFKKGFGPHLTLAVDRHGVIRELTTRFECARLNGEFFELQLDFYLQEVNQAIETAAVAKGEPLGNLLRELGTTQEAALHAEAEEIVIAFLKGLGGSLTGRLP